MATAGNFTIDSVTTSDGRYAGRSFGGDCVYAAVGARVWGAAVRVISVVGSDYPPEWLRLLDSNGIRTDLVRRIEAPHGLIAPMRYDDEGRRENERSSAESTPDIPIRPSETWRTFSPTARDARPSLHEVDCMHLAPMPVESQNELLALAAGQVPLITLDIPWFPGRTRRGDLPEVGFASAVLLSEAEIVGHYPGSSAEDAAADLMRRGVGIVAVKQGGRGSVVFSHDRPEGVRLPVFQTKVVDPTGAGDAYCGGFGVGLSQRGDPISAGLYGTVAASFVIEGFGADYALRYGAPQALRRLDLLRSRIEVSQTSTSPGPS